MSTDKAGDFLSSQAKSASGALKTFFTTAEGLYDKKLWHELTRLLLDQLLALPEARPKLHAIYENFVSPWAQKMKPLSRVKVRLYILISCLLLSTVSISLKQSLAVHHM